jgi:Mg-chelatase subunit ChlD
MIFSTSDQDQKEHFVLKKVIPDEGGRALVLALIVLGVGALLLPTFLAHISTNLYASQATEVGITEYYGADAAIEYTLWRIRCEPGFVDTLTVDAPSYITPTVGNQTVSVSLTKLSPGEGRRLLDVVLVLDRSLSMEGGPIADAKIAAKAFVDLLDPAYDQVGLVSYSTDATLDHQLTNDFEAVKTTIDGISTYGYTNIGGAIEEATGELTSPRAREDSVKVQVLLSDGIANVYDDTFCGVTGCPEAAEYALDAAEAAANEDITIFGISLGEGADQELMEDIASEGYYAHAPSSSDLQYLFESIAHYYTATQYDIVATAGGTTIESRVQASKELDMVGIITWLMR